ncbi:hypothetical protein Gasu2_33140 [Galdieria sulphuraria]|nr:hypothetical protein Gasu2_33140 [Galdieria sulphuraria]
MTSDSFEKKYVYVLKLQQNKWYIGSTTNIKQRIAQHCQGTGCAWTSRYPFLELFDCQLQRDGWHEENLTKEYMLRYGIENVRGGPYTNLELTEEEKEVIQRALDAFRGACYLCGSRGHLAAECPTCDFKCSESAKDFEYSESQACFRCGRWGHYVADCYATTHRNGLSIDSRRTTSSNETFSADSNTCFRCGRWGHYVADCYATTHRNGQRIDE